MVIFWGLVILTALSIMYFLRLLFLHVRLVRHFGIGDEDDAVHAKDRRAHLALIASICAVLAILAVNAALGLNYGYPFTVLGFLKLFGESLIELAVFALLYALWLGFVFVCKGLWTRCKRS